jgi:hypothetical protein
MVTYIMGGTSQEYPVTTVIAGAFDIFRYSVVRAGKQMIGYAKHEYPSIAPVILPLWDRGRTSGSGENMTRLTTDERREFVRLPKPFSVQAFEFKFPMASQPRVETTCVDISTGGLCLESPFRFDQGSKVQVRVHIPTLNKYSGGFFKHHENDIDQFLNAIAEVAWVENSYGKYLVGIRFLDIDWDTQNALKRLIDKAAQEN